MVQFSCFSVTKKELLQESGGATMPSKMHKKFDGQAGEVFGEPVIASIFAAGGNNPDQVGKGGPSISKVVGAVVSTVGGERLGGATERLVEQSLNLVQTTSDAMSGRGKEQTPFNHDLAKVHLKPHGQTNGYFLALTEHNFGIFLSGFSKLGQTLVVCDRTVIAGSFLTWIPIWHWPGNVVFSVFAQPETFLIFQLAAYFKRADIAFHNELRRTLSLAANIADLAFVNQLNRSSFRLRSVNWNKWATDLVQIYNLGSTGTTK